jgi:GGDEF domain-containing protein
MYKSYRINITDRKQAENSIRSMAYYDILTGLRKMYEERLAQEISRCSQEESML